MILILNKFETVEQSLLYKANLVLKRNGPKTFKVLKHRWSKRKMLRQDEVGDFVTKTFVKAL